MSDDKNKYLEKVKMEYLSAFSKEPYKLYINGSFVPSDSGEIIEMRNPATGELLAKAYQGNEEDAQMAIFAARKAFDEGPWGEMSGTERGVYLSKAREILASRAESFAKIETADAGKNYPGVLHYEVQQSIDAFDFYAHKARTISGHSMSIDSTCFAYGGWRPYGVVGEILPWNGPLMMGCQKVCAILAAGNTVVIKPPGWASASLLALAEVFHDAGFPAGVINIVTGSGSVVGDAIVRSPLVDMVSMTGSTSTGKEIIRSSADTIKALALELGGKSPNIIFDDVDVESAAKWATQGFTLHSGQVCVSGTRILVQRNIYEHFTKEVSKCCQDFRPGNGFDYEKGVNFNTLIHANHAKEVWQYIKSGKDEGARLICGGEPYTEPELAKGHFVPPTVFADVTPEMTIFKEEIFGPVACITPFDSEKDAITLANMTDYGLAGAVFSTDIKRAHRVAERIRAGQIYINTYFSKGILDVPTSGWKESGLGVAGIYKYMNNKSIFVNLEEHN